MLCALLFISVEKVRVAQDEAQGVITTGWASMIYKKNTTGLMSRMWLG